MKFMLLNITLFLILNLFSCNEIDNNFEPKKPINNIGETDSTFHFKDGIISIFEDSNGNYWFGTKENGACKYDGKNYTYFTVKDGLPINQVQEIQEDKNGNILLVTGSRICLFDGEQLTILDTKDEWDGIKNKENFNTPSSAKWEVNHDYHYFQSMNNGILRYNGSKLDYLAIPIPEGDNINERDDIPPMVYMPFTKIYKDKDSKIWIGTFARGIVGFDGKEFIYLNPDKFGSATLRGIFQDQSGNYWFGSNGNGLYRYNGKGIENFSVKKNLYIPKTKGKSSPINDLSSVWAIQQDNEGKMWFGTIDSGVWVYDGNKMINFDLNDGLTENSIEIIFKDSKGELWFCSGMNTKGYVYKFNGQSFEKFNGFDIGK